MIAWRWSGDSMEPLSRFRKECDTEFVIGEVYLLEKYEERSGVSHRHLFASVATAWQNLPDDVGIPFASPDALRKYALIKAGFCDCNTLVCSSNKEAQKVAAFIRPIDGFSIVAVNGSSISHYTAKSQSMKAMGKAEFQRSKDEVLRILAEMLGTTVPALQSAGSGE